MLGVVFGSEFGFRILSVGAWASVSRSQFGCKELRIVVQDSWFGVRGLESWFRTAIPISP